MGMAWAGQISDMVPPLFFVTKLIFESPTNFGKELPIGSWFLRIKKKKKLNFISYIFT